MDPDKVAALRRVAIVLSSLPETTANRLLAGLAPDHQRAVRMAVGGLADVDPLERRRALSGFATSIRRGRSPLAGQNDAAEIVLSKVALQHSGARPDVSPPSPPPAQAVGPLAFLGDVDDDALADQVRQEHPQTIAIILAWIAPAQAARILPKLSVTVRTEAMRRLAKLDNPPSELIDDIGSQLKHKLLASGTPFTSGHSRFAASGSAHTSAGQATLRAILAEMPDSDSHAPAAASTPLALSRPAPVADSRDAAPYRDAPPASGQRHASSDQPARPAAPADEVAEDSWPLRESTDAIHARLVATPATRLREALAVVPTRQSLLALCGLPTATAEKVLGSLPRRQARQIRQQIAELGTLELREIDRAKEAVAAAVDQLANHASGRPLGSVRSADPPSKLAVAA